MLELERSWERSVSTETARSALARCLSLSRLVLNMSKDVFSNPDCCGIACSVGCLLNHSFRNERSQRTNPFSPPFGKPVFNGSGCRRSTKDNGTVAEQLHLPELSENVTHETAAPIIQNGLSMESYI